MVSRTGQGSGQSQALLDLARRALPRCVHHLRRRALRDSPNLTIPAGNRIPGVARSALHASLAWVPALGWRGGIEARALGRIYVNDANSDSAGGHAVANVNLGYVAQVGAWQWSAFGRIDNVLGRRYAGSVIVNEGNARFFEPAPQRTWTAGVAAVVAF